jgi:transposase
MTLEEGDPAMKILAIDMGWSNSVSCLFNTDSGEVQYKTVITGKEPFARLLQEMRPEKVVIEAGPMAGWVRDLCEQMKLKLLVLNTNDEPWRWRNLKKKTDRQDAFKLARVAALGEGSAVHVPEHSVRQWRQLIYYRQTLVDAMVAIKNRLRAVLLQEDLHLPSGRKAWEKESWRKLGELAVEFSSCAKDELWRGIVMLELRRLEELAAHLAVVEKKLDGIAREDERVKRLKQVPGVGARTAELVVALIDDPQRFGRGRRISAYAGLSPRKHQSGKMDRDGHISRCGSGLLRRYLVQASWSGKRSCEPMQQIYQRVRKGSPRRSKQAIVAVARHLLVWLWAMLRDGSSWHSKAPAPPLAGLLQVT